MTYGLLAALAWGVATLGAAFAARRIGAFRTVIVGEGVGLTGYALLFWLGGFSLRGSGPQVWPLLAAGLIGVIGYLAMYRGLESGHIGLVSAISASYGGITVILSVLLLRERLGALAASGVALTVLGVMFASSRGTSGGVRTARAAGVAFGLAAAVCYGVSGFLLGRGTQTLGWLVPVVIARSGAMALLLALLAAGQGRSSPRGRAAGFAVAAAAGLADAAGLVFFARGDQVGLVAITAATSSAYPLIPLAGGLLLLRERLAPRQAGGAALILAGLVMLGLGS